MELLQDEATRQAQLDRMKRRATALLILATVIFFVTRILEPRLPWIAIVRATAEAAMVGGLADWFAVTALFRHPMGIPIPHTAIVPARKDRVGRTLGVLSLGGVEIVSRVASGSGDAAGHGSACPTVECTAGARPRRGKGQRAQIGG